MTQEDDKGFFDKLGEIFNAPLPGTRGSGSQPRVPAEDDDDDSLLERIKDVLQTPLPGTPQAESGNQTPGPAPTSPASQPTATGTVAPQSREKTPQLDEDDLDEPWWQQDWAGFRAHQERERNGLELKQRRDQEKFAAYQRQESQRFHAHQQQELDAFTRQQQWRLTAWRQAVANSPGQRPPPPPWGMQPGSPMPGPMGGPPTWMLPPGPGRRRS